MLPQENRAGNDATHGGAALCFYYDHFVGGFRLPLSSFAARVCEHYGVCPMQWTPNSWRMITGFESICKQVNRLPSFSVFSHLVTTKKTGDWVSLCYGSTFSGFVTTLEKENEGWKSRFFVLRRAAGRTWGFRTSWLAGKVKKIGKVQLTNREKELLELCKRYRFLWQQTCGLERLNALKMVGSELPAEAVPELLALDMKSGKEILRFIYPTPEHPDGLRVRYKGKDAAKLLGVLGGRRGGKQEMPPAPQVRLTPRQ